MIFYHVVPNVNNMGSISRAIFLLTNDSLWERHCTESLCGAKSQLLYQLWKQKAITPLMILLSWFISRVAVTFLLSFFFIFPWKAARKHLLLSVLVTDPVLGLLNRSGCVSVNASELYRLFLCQHDFMGPSKVNKPFKHLLLSPLTL